MRVPRLVRSAAVCTLFVLAFELAARHFGWFDPTERDDPYLGFPGTSPLYRVERAEDGSEVYSRSPNKDRYRAVSFPVEKPPREFRVFCVGGSSVRSDAFMNPDASFPHLLEIYLTALLADRVPRVINAGGGGAGSIQNLEVVREVLDDQPDLLVIYPEGGEKNLVPPLPQGVMARADDASPLRVFARRHLAPLRLYGAVRLAYDDLLPRQLNATLQASAFSTMSLSAIAQPFSPTTFSRVFEFKLDRVPPVMPHPIPVEEIEHAHQRFERNLDTMAELARAAGVPILFVQPLRNIKASFYLRFHIDPSEIRDGDVDGWRAAYEAGLAAKRAGDWEQAVTALRAVREFYPVDRDEILAFDLGECLEQLGRYEEAQAEYAKPYLEHPMHALIAKAGADEGVPVVDPFPDLVAIAEHGIPGFDFFTDSFHPMPVTSRVVAQSVIKELRELGLGGRQRPEAHAAFAAEEKRVQDIIDRSPAPKGNLMMRAILAGDYDEAVRIGQSIPEANLLDTGLTESFYLGWALTKADEPLEARRLFAKMRARQWKPWITAPVLATDEDLVKYVFGGDLWAWF
jgi:tetratricopeptide (TPR) repeat protein